MGQQTVPIPFTTGVNHGASVLHRGCTCPPGIPWVFIVDGLSGWRHGHSWHHPGSPPYLTAFPVAPNLNILKQPGHEPVQQGSSRVTKVVHGAATIVTWFIMDHQNGKTRPLRSGQ